MNKILKSIGAGIGIAVIAVSLLAVVSPRSSQAESPARAHRESVSAWVFQSGKSVVGQDGVGHYHYTGGKIYASSSSAGAPQFPNGLGDDGEGDNLVSIGDATATLLEAGFHLEKVSDNGLFFLFIK